MSAPESTKSAVPPSRSATTNAFDNQSGMHAPRDQHPARLTEYPTKEDGWPA